MLSFSVFDFNGLLIHIFDAYTYIESSTCNPHLNFSLYISHLKSVIYTNVLNQAHVM